MTTAGNNAAIARRVSLESAASYGIEDYSEEFARAKNDSQTDDVFSNIINQERAVKKFADALSLRNRAILNLGDAGIGKSTITKDLMDALQALDRGETITGEYAPDVIAFHKRLQANRHGDIVGLWNPKDYTAPLIVRTHVNREGGKRVAEDIAEQIMDYTSTLAIGFTTIIKDLYAREYVLGEMHKRLLDFKKRSMEGSVPPKKDATIIPDETIQAPDQESTPYAADAKQGIDLDTLEWNVIKDRNGRRTSGYRLQIPGMDEERYTALNKELAVIFEQTTSIFTHGNAAEALAYVLGKGPQFIREKRKSTTEIRDEAERTLEEVLMACNSDLRKNGEAWKGREPAISGWFNDVAEYINKPERRKDIVEQVAALQHAKPKSKKGEKKKKDDDDEENDFQIEPYSIFVDIIGRSFPLPELLAPQTLYSEDASGKTVIRKLNVFEHMDLFANMDGYGKDMDEPLHHQIELGPLAYADLVVMDEGIGDSVLDPEFRRALLTFLQDGTINTYLDKVQINTSSDCFMIANETDFPFYREKFKNESPTYDEGMHRRFSVVEWQPHVEANADNRKSFPTILKRSSEEIRKEWSGAGDIGFSPQATNLLYQYLIASNDGLLFPMNIGEQQDKIYIPLLQQARRKGRTQVTAEDVVQFVSEKRNVLLEKVYTHFTLMQHGRETSEPKVGQTYGLWVTSDSQGVEYGGIGRVNIMVAPRVGKLTSTDMDAEMTDETYRKGMSMTNAWLQSVFGPFDVDIRTSFVGYEGIGGPSAGAAHTYAIMSALGKIPVDQNTFMTGTILDQDGTVGVIGGVYGKVRGAHMFTKTLRETNGEAPQPITVLIPKMNAREFVRNLLFDKELQRTMDDGQLRVQYHDRIWDGFETMSGMPRSEYEPRIRTAINDIETRASMHDYRLRNAMRDPPKQRKK